MNIPQGLVAGYEDELDAGLEEDAAPPEGGAVKNRRTVPNALRNGFRWFVELDLRSVKEVMHMGVLRGKTPAMVKKEIWAHVLAYNLVRKLMLQAAMRYDQSPRSMSFKLALQMISAFRQAGSLSESDQEVYTALLKALISKKTGKQKRPSQPRVVKRRPKAFPRMQKPRAEYMEIEAVA